jgi:uncharacterized membrane protein (DUF4010 family)
MNFLITSRKQLGFLCAIVLSLWWLPDQLMGPYNAWNPHALMEFVLTLFAISFISQWIIRQLGAHHGLLIMGLMGGFASSTATIHSMGSVAKAEPSLAARAALSGVLSNIATLIQLVILLNLLAPDLLTLVAIPIGFGSIGLLTYAALMMPTQAPDSLPVVSNSNSLGIDWKGMALLILLVCTLSLVSASLNSVFGQKGLWLGSVLSGLVDAHALVPSLASLMDQGKLSTANATLPLLFSLTANSLTKSVLALQSGGWVYAKRVSAGIWMTTVFVWLGYWTCSVSNFFAG